MVVYFHIIRDIRSDINNYAVSSLCKAVDSSGMFLTVHRCDFTQWIECCQIQCHTRVSEPPRHLQRKDT